MPSGARHISSTAPSTWTDKQNKGDGYLCTRWLITGASLNSFYKGWHTAPTLCVTLCGSGLWSAQCLPEAAACYCRWVICRDGEEQRKGGGEEVVEEWEEGQRQCEAKSKGLPSIQISQFPVLCHQVLRSSFGVCHELHAHLRAQTYPHSDEKERRRDFQPHPSLN